MRSQCSGKSIFRVFPVHCSLTSRKGCLRYRFTRNTSDEEERLKSQRYFSTFQKKAANRPHMKLIRTNHLPSNNAKLASLMAGNGSVLLSDGHTIQVYANQSNEDPSEMRALFTSEFKHATAAFCELSESDIAAIERLLSCECPITRMLEYEKWRHTHRPAFVWQ
jgi:hypothetical protein